MSFEEKRTRYIDVFLVIDHGPNGGECPARACPGGDGIVRGVYWTRELAEEAVVQKGWNRDNIVVAATTVVGYEE